MKTYCFIEILITHPEGLDPDKIIVILRPTSSADLFHLDIESAAESSGHTLQVR